MAVKHFILIFCAGGAGALSRFGLAALVNKLVGGPFPWGTLVVNMVGCLAFGVLWQLISSRALSDPARMIILVGFVGSFTTFSSFVFDSFALGGSRPVLALMNILFQNIIGLFSLYLGVSIAKFICK